MIKAVIFDMYETLITQYGGPVYFRAQMAADAGIDPMLLMHYGFRVRMTGQLESRHWKRQLNRY